MSIPQAVVGKTMNGLSICGARNSNTSLLLMKFKVKLEIAGRERKQSIREFEGNGSNYV